SKQRSWRGIAAVSNIRRPISIGRFKRTRAPNGVTSTSRETSFHSFPPLSRHDTRTGKESAIRSRRRREWSACFSDLVVTRNSFGKRSALLSQKIRRSREFIGEFAVFQVAATTISR